MDQILGQYRQTLEMVLSHPVFESDITPFDIAEFGHAGIERVAELAEAFKSRAVEKSNYRYS